MTSMNQDRFLFIVGLPKTGTKLIENILRKSSGTDYRTVGETFFMGHFIRKGVKDSLHKFGDLAHESNVRKLVNHFFTGNLKGGYWQGLSKQSFGINRNKFVNDILKSERNPRDIYRIILNSHDNINERTILGDKTPGNLYHVRTLLDWFPGAKIIHTLRDPRAILASEWRKRTMRVPADYLIVKPKSPFYEFMIFLHVITTWLYAVRLHKIYRVRYPANYYMSKFEDLILSPEDQIKSLCQFLNINYNSDMLNPRLSGSSYERFKGSGFDERSLNRWQTYLKPWMSRWANILCKKYLRELGYIPAIGSK